MKHIYYFNITYGCNSQCVFCYSHHTRHGGESWNDISFPTFCERIACVQPEDRVILNGGEPLLHPYFLDMVDVLRAKGCEVLIYTNGRLLSSLPLEHFTDHFRFILPWHGPVSIHDRITGIPGSQKDMQLGLVHMLPSKARMELKFIINWEMLYGKPLKDALQSLSAWPLSSLNAIHITKVADTIVARSHHCPVVSEQESAHPTRRFFELCQYVGIPVKIFDTCVSELPLSGNALFHVAPFDVQFNDWKQQRMIPLKESENTCFPNCPHHKYCKSAVLGYTTLAYDHGQWEEDLE